MKLSIIIPCYNEQNTISLVIHKILSSYTGEKEIIVIDDCSNDKTSDILKTDKLIKKTETNTIPFGMYV